MGVGNYNRRRRAPVLPCLHRLDDTQRPPSRFEGIPRFGLAPTDGLDWQFEYLSEDHDHGEKAFLGERGDFDGEDVIYIICRNPATARFIARHLYNFFVEDEAQVPAWQTVPPNNPDAIDLLASELMESDYDHPLHSQDAVQLQTSSRRLRSAV